MIFNIQKCSVHDGDGLRTLVFFKGCPLGCKWCANPESQSFQQEIMESSAKCIGCMRCVKECPEKAVVLTEAGPTIDRKSCVKCFHCTEICYAGAKYVTGKAYTVRNFLKRLRRTECSILCRRECYLFGGSSVQAEFLTQIAKKCHEEGIHVMLESCGYAEYEKFKTVLPFIDAMFMDLKHIDTEIHRS